MLQPNLKNLLQRATISYSWVNRLANHSVAESEQWLGQLQLSRICVDWSLRQADSALIYMQHHSRIQLAQLHDLHTEDCVIILTDTKAISTNKPVLYITDLEDKLPELLLAYFNIQAITMRLIAVTGTNGKSSIVYFIAQLLHKLSEDSKVGLLGTLGNGLYRDNQPLPISTLTTLGMVELYEKIAELQKQGADYVVMEASSHGIQQQRLRGLTFDTVVFSNLSHDHLYYHGDMETYYQAKKQLFRHFVGPQSVAVLNLNNAYGKRLHNELQTESYLDLISVSAGVEKADMTLGNIQLSPQGSQFDIQYQQYNHRLNLAVFGYFQIENIALAIGVVSALGFAFKHIVTKALEVIPPLGRMQCVTPPQVSKNLPVFVDYAHTPDALNQAITALHHHYGQSTDGVKVSYICVFGCGGNRDQCKRSAMGEIAAKQADIIVVTDDNPRNEDATTIRRQIYTAAYEVITADYPHKQLFEIANRQQAIETAVELATKQKNRCVIIIAGKGHEEYQVVLGKRYRFSDVQVAQQALLRIKNA